MIIFENFAYSLLSHGVAMVGKNQRMGRIKTMDKKAWKTLSYFLVIAIIVFMIATQINTKSERIPEKLIEHQEMLREQGILK